MSPALSRPLPPDSALTGAARPAWAPRAERENLRREPGPEPQGEGAQGVGGTGQGEPLVREGANGRAFPKMWIFRNRNPCGLADPRPRQVT